MIELFKSGSEGAGNHLEKTSYLVKDIGEELGRISSQIKEETDEAKKAELKRNFQQKQDYLNTMFRLSKSKSNPSIK